MKLKKMIYVFALLIVSTNFLQNVNAIANYKATSLEDLISQIRIIKPNSIAFAYKVFDEVDCGEFLGRSNILSHGYLPIQLTIENNSDRYLSFSLDDLSFPCISYKEVTEKVQFSTFKRIFLWGLPWWIVLPVPDRRGNVRCYGIPGSSICLILVIIEAIKSPRANKQLEYDYSVKALHDQVIRPHSNVNGIVFVKKEQFNYSFTFGLMDHSTGERFVLSSDKKQISL